MDEHRLHRRSPFAYRCAACNRCCHGKRIQLNPYELARLAEGLGIPVAELIAEHTDDGVYLRQRDDGACVFLGEEGCTVHPHRPLVCRVYPLGRIVSSEEEYFVEVTPHPQTAGRYGRDGTVAEYLEQQGAAPFMAAADHYYRLYLQLTQAQGEEEDAAEAGFEPLDLLDLEAYVRREAARRGTAPAAELEGRVRQHVRWLHEALTGEASTEG